MIRTRDLLKLLTVREVAVILRTTPNAIYRMVERAQIDGVIRRGRRLLFCQDDLVNWLDQNRAPSPKE
jgi:excisionase family DNA binding protein